MQRSVVYPMRRSGRDTRQKRQRASLLATGTQEPVGSDDMFSIAQIHRSDLGAAIAKRTAIVSGVSTGGLSWPGGLVIPAEP